MINPKECTGLFEYAKDKYNPDSKIKITNMTTKYDLEKDEIWCVTISFTTDNYYTKSIDGECADEEIISRVFMYEKCTVENVKNFIDKIAKGDIYGD